MNVKRKKDRPVVTHRREDKRKHNHIYIAEINKKNLPRRTYVSKWNES